MALDANILFQGKAPDINDTFRGILDNVKGVDAIKNQRAMQPIAEQLKNLEVETQQEALTLDKLRNDGSRRNQFITSVAEGAAEIGPALQAGDIEGARGILTRRIADLRAKGETTETSEEALMLLDQNPELLKQRTNQAIELGKRQGVFSGGQNLASSVQEINFKAKALVGAPNPDNNNQPYTEAEAQQAIILRNEGIVARAGMSAQERIASDPSTIQDVADSEATIKGAVTTAQENAKVNVKVGTAEKVGNAQSKINFLSTTGTLEASDLNLLKKTSGSRVRNLAKAKGFKNALESGLRSSGVGRQAASFAPIGVWTDQGSFDEIFNSFSEVAAREKLKASGELRPTDADVQGMKAAMFGVGRSEPANIELLNDFIEEQESMEAQLNRPAGQRNTPSQQRQGGKIMIDGKGNRARVFDDGTFEELP
tara:strand:- start:4235 stop:5515 length:1281 start_codon:yes stop_codon:yes gene_type:complete